MHSAFSNTALTFQATINRLTRKARHRRQWQKNWHDDGLTYATGSLLGDCLLGTAVGLVIFLWVLS